MQICEWDTVNPQTLDESSMTGTRNNLKTCTKLLKESFGHYLTSIYPQLCNAPKSNYGIQHERSTMCCKMPPAKRSLICEGYCQMQTDVL